VVRQLMVLVWSFNVSSALHPQHLVLIGQALLLHDGNVSLHSLDDMRRWQLDRVSSRKQPICHVRLDAESNRIYSPRVGLHDQSVWSHVVLDAYLPFATGQAHGFLRQHRSPISRPSLSHYSKSSELPARLCNDASHGQRIWFKLYVYLILPSEVYQL